MAKQLQSKKPLIHAFIVFIILSSGILFLTYFYDFSHIDLGGLLFLLAFLCTLFITKNVYDLGRTAAASEELKKHVVMDIAISPEELYVQLYKNSPVPYLIIDLEGHIKSANVSAVRMLGVTQVKVKGINIFSRLQSENLEHLDFLIEKFQNGIAISDETILLKRYDQRQVWVLLSLFSFSDISGHRIGLLTMVDITKQKRAEDAKSEFVSLASHQLRTPIAGMKWSAELLLMDNPDALTERQHKYIDRLLISIKRMAVLVDDFLRVSRFELGTFQAEYKTTSLTELFEEIVAEQAPRVMQKKLDVKTFFDESVDTIVTDPNLLRMIVTNLYSNATKYTRESGTIHLGFGRKDDTLVITVADNGMGIPADDQDQIFSKLFRAANAVRNVPDGTGLGLYIVREAVSVLKGQISFTTTENIGTTFEVILPLELPERKKA
jgi:PAS domain S-box-containing protein